MKQYLSLFLPLILIGCAPTLSKVDQDMFVAVKANNTQEVERLIAAGANVNVPNKQVDDLTPLGWAAFWGSNDVTVLLLEHGADINRSSNGITPLHAAAYKGQKGTVELLIRKGADVNAGRNGGWTPLHKALEELAFDYISKEASPSRVAAAGDIMDILIAKGADVNAQSGPKISPIHFAAMSGQKSLIERLVTKGADVNAKDRHNVTPLYYAAKMERADVADWLIAHRAEVDSRTKSGYTPLIIAAENGCSNTVKVLLDHGADVSAKGKDDLTPLLKATNSLKAFHTLSSPSPVAKQMRDKMGRSMVEQGRKALEEVKGQWHEVAVLLVARGAEININVGENNPLYIAALVGDKRLVEALLDKGADINYYNGQETPLHGAIGEGQEEIAELLIVRGANVNAKNMNQRTPLHYLATFSDSKKLAELMIQHHADVNAKSKDGDTPLALAIAAGHKNIAEVLRQHGGK
jgi:cytohesin